MSLLRRLGIVSIVGGLIGSVQALDTIGRTSNNDRFTVSGGIFPTGTFAENTNPGFVGAGFDWSGVGWINNTSGDHNVAMITDRHFLGANHNNPGGSIAFLSPGSGIITRTVSSFTPLAGTDLALGTLSAPVTSDIAIYPLGVPPTSNLDFLGRDIFVYGNGDLSGPSTSPRIGIDEIGLETVLGPSFGFSNTTYGLTTLPNTPVYAFEQNPSVTHQAEFQPEDSGGPSFMVANGELSLVGIHMFRGVSGGRNLGFDIYLPAYQSTIEGLGIGARFVTIPEPSRAVLVMVGVVGILMQRRR